MKWRVAVDTGGTFTDFVGFDEDTGGLRSRKVSSRPQNPSAAVMDSLTEAIASGELVDLVHGTTVGTNAILEGKAPEVGLITTEGFSDILEMRNWWREHLFGNEWTRPASLIPRRFCRGVSERVNSKGKVLKALDENHLREIIADFRILGVASYAVCFLFSFLNNSNEKKAEDFIHKTHPEALVSLSCNVLPEIREYQRTSTTVLNAQLKPVIAHYLNRLQSQLADCGAGTANLRIMKSNGGIMTSERATESAFETLKSGPAGGMTASKVIGELIGAKDLITFDMGGTSTDIGIIYRGIPQFATENDLRWNIPVRGSMMDIRSIGAGGGSIAWIDEAGALNVGPESAGADPGPVCYGKGGSNPTITDANLILGRISKERFWGGNMKLDHSAAIKAMEDEVACHYGWDTVRAAQGIYEISLANIALLIREMTINRGYDPRDFVLMSFGGAGGLYAAKLASELGIKKVCIPMHAATFSALGGLMSDFIYDFVHSYFVTIEGMDYVKLNSLCNQLWEQGEAQLMMDDTKKNAIFQFSADMRYIGESWELTVPLLFDGQVKSESLKASVEKFHEMHKQLYSLERPIEPVELVGIRLKVIVPKDKPALERISSEGVSREALVERRRVFFKESNGLTETPVYRRSALGASAEVKGPAVIEENDTTVVVFPRQKATVDSYGNLIVETT